MVQLIEEHDGGNNRRFVVELEDGARVEAVVYRGDTLCISSQVGCAVACPFCASGARGFGRNLKFEELVGQLQAVQGLGVQLARITVSGVGEPLHNPALPEFITHCRDVRIGPSLTTTGGPLSRLRPLLHSHHNGITLSVHAGTEATRRRMVPNGPSLADLFALLHEEVELMTGRRKRRLALAYLMVAGLNDSAEELAAFAELARPLPFTIHLFDYNPVPTSPFEQVSRSAYEQAYQQLMDAGLRVRMSSQARLQKNGGCGTLVALRAGKSSLPVSSATAAG